MNLRPVSAKSAEESNSDTSVCRAATGEMPVPDGGSLPIWAARISLGLDAFGIGNDEAHDDQ